MLFSKFVNISAEQYKRSYAKRLRTLAIEIAVNVLDVAQAIVDRDSKREQEMFQLQYRIYLSNGLLEIMVSNTCNFDLVAAKLEIEEVRQAARAFAFMPFNIMLIVNPITLNKPIKKAGEENMLTVENYIKGLDNLVNLFGKSEGSHQTDFHSQYFALYSLFTFISEAQRRMNAV